MVCPTNKNKAPAVNKLRVWLGRGNNGLRGYPSPVFTLPLDSSSGVVVWCDKNLSPRVFWFGPTWEDALLFFFLFSVKLLGHLCYESETKGWSGLMTIIMKKPKELLSGSLPSAALDRAMSVRLCFNDAE